MMEKEKKCKAYIVRQYLDSILETIIQSFELIENLSHGISTHGDLYLYAN